MSNPLITTLWNLTENIIGEHLCELVDIEYVKEGKDFFLRFFIDKEGGINLSDCQNVSRALDPLLDQWESEKLIKISQSYHLEVSSPGLNRPLKRTRDYERNVGKLIEVTLYKAFSGKKKYEGVLLSFSKETEELELLISEELTLNILKNEIAKARKIDIID